MDQVKVLLEELTMVVLDPMAVVVLLEEQQAMVMPDPVKAMEPLPSVVATLDITLADGWDSLLVNCPSYILSTI